MKETAREVVPYEEVERQYPDEWVLIEITRDHKDHRRVKGRLLAHSSDRAALDEPHRRFRGEHPDALLYEFYTGDIVAEGVTPIL